MSNPRGTVFAFEPYFFNFDRLKKNCELNEVDNIVLHAIAVGNDDGTIQFSIPKSPRIIDVASTDHEFSSRVYGNDVEWSQVDVEQICLDTFVRTYTDGTKVDLIKIDVELYERQVFDGMKSVLAEHRPNILFESFVDRDRIEFFNAVAEANDLTPYAVMRRGILRLDDGFIENPDGLNFFFSPVRSARLYTAKNQLDDFVSEILGE